MFRIRNFDIKLTFFILAIVLAIVAFTGDSFGQTKLSRRCPGSSPSPANAFVEVEKDGDITLTACSGRSVTALVPSYSGLGNGSAGSPSVTFTSDTDTGFYRAGANQFAITAGGSQVALYSSAGETLTGALTTTGAIELGNASDTTIARGSAGVVTIEGVNVVTTSSTDTLTNKTLTSAVLNTPEIGNASDTTLSRVSAGKLAVEGVNIVTVSSTDTLTNKRVTLRIGTTASSATPTPDADANDVYTVTALAAGATFGAPTGTPTDGQILRIRVKDNGTSRSLAFNAVYRFSSDLAAPSATTINKTLYLVFIWNAADSKWDNLSQLNNF